MRYTVLIDGEAGAYGVVFPDLPGCCAMGDTVDEALANASDSVADWIPSMKAQGDVPGQRSIDALRLDPDVIGALADGAVFAHVLYVPEISRPVKANLSLDAGILAEIDAAADRSKITRSAMVELMARRVLPELA